MSSEPSVTDRMGLTSNRTVEASNGFWVELMLRTAFASKWTTKASNELNVRLLVQKEEIIVERYT